MHAVSEQKEQCKHLHGEIQQLKSQPWQTQLPEWASRIVPANNMPFLLLSVQDFTTEELRDSAQALNKKQPGFYLLITVRLVVPLLSLLWSMRAVQAQLICKN